MNPQYPNIPESAVRFTEVLQGGATWSHILKRNTALKLTNLQSNANVSLLAFNFELLCERLNLPDTLKAQHTSKITAGHCLYSDMGRILLSVIYDSVGWHDPLCGPSTPETIHAAFGSKNFYQARNAFHRNGRENFLIELGKYGLGEPDLVMCLNLFSKVVPTETGQLTFYPNSSPPNSSVILRSEMNTLVILSATPHPLEPPGTYNPSPIELVVFTTPPPAADDLCRISCPENQRGFQLTERYFL
ncbi:MAG: urea carboxylase-associated family protein [Chthoniobacterales bacterium]|nr:urea carboxylase-associated family protein [Chthoniobacterales bacterium]